MPALLAGWSQVAAAHDHHSTFSAGEAGNSRKPARTVGVAMSEMAYESYRIEVKRGEQIRFVLHIEAEKTSNGYVVTKPQKAR